MTATLSLLLVASCGAEPKHAPTPTAQPTVALATPQPTPEPTPEPTPTAAPRPATPKAPVSGGELPRGKDAASIAARRAVLEPMVRAAFPESPDAAVAIAHCETGGRWEPWAVSKTNDFGLMQLNAPTWRSSWEGSWGLGPWDPNVYDPALNLRGARIIWEGAGGSWRPWTCRRVL